MNRLLSLLMGLSLTVASAWSETKDGDSKNTVAIQSENLREVTPFRDLDKDSLRSTNNEFRLTVSSKFEGTKDGGGGDTVAILFKNLGEESLRSLKKHWCHQGEEELLIILRGLLVVSVQDIQEVSDADIVINRKQWKKLSFSEKRKKILRDLCLFTGVSEEEVDQIHLPGLPEKALRNKGSKTKPRWDLLPADEFKEVGRTFLIRLFKKQQKLPQIPSSALQDALAKVKVETSEDPLPLINGASKDAINYPSENRVLLYLPSWRSADELMKRRLVIHELFGLIGISDQQYKDSYEALLFSRYSFKDLITTASMPCALRNDGEMLCQGYPVLYQGHKFYLGHPGLNPSGTGKAYLYQSNVPYADTNYLTVDAAEVKIWKDLKCRDGLCVGDRVCRLIFYQKNAYCNGRGKILEFYEKDDVFWQIESKKLKQKFKMRLRDTNAKSLVKIFPCESSMCSPQHVGYSRLRNILVLYNEKAPHDLKFVDD